jgi:hypothetical protein
MYAFAKQGSIISRINSEFFKDKPHLLLIKIRSPPRVTQLLGTRGSRGASKSWQTSDDDAARTCERRKLPRVRLVRSSHHFWTDANSPHGRCMPESAKWVSIQPNTIFSPVNRQTCLNAEEHKATRRPSAFCGSTRTPSSASRISRPYTSAPYSQGPVLTERRGEIPRLVLSSFYLIPDGF